VDIPVTETARETKVKHWDSSKAFLEVLNKISFAGQTTQRLPQATDQTSKKTNRDYFLALLISFRRLPISTPSNSFFSRYTKPS
jgi:hypothetical protein